ncbi:MAG TPA: fatty acid desaturase family protein, partial [Caulobacterales bacterium]|nr:fatty acid desaturase family protein [Caulobacterales bacterium]
MSAVARVDPKTVFTPEEWARLTTRSSWRGLLNVAGAWALIIAAGAIFVVWPNPLTYILAVMLIGARQLGLAILMHDAAHGALHPNQRINDWVGEWLCAAPVGAKLDQYRPYHLKHHRYTEQPEDPDLGLSAPFPITHASLVRKIIRDLTGQTFVKQRFGPLFAKREERTGGKVTSSAVNSFLIVNAILFAALALAGYWWAYFALWIVPMATWFPLVTRLRNIAEHACVDTREDPFSHARTTKANLIERLLIAPFWVHHHAEHHCFMHLPCYKLPET